MLRVITGSTYRSYQQAVTEAGKVPDLEAKLGEEREHSEDLVRQHLADQDQQRNARAEDARTIESLQDQLQMLRAAAGKTAGALAAPQSPQSAVYHSARWFLAHADLLGLGDTTTSHLQTLVEPQRVYLLRRRGELQTTAYTTLEAAKKGAEQQGAALDGWGPEKHREVSDQGDEEPIPHWCITSLVMDYSTPWIALGKPLTDVLVVLKSGTPYAIYSDEADAQRIAATLRDSEVRRVTVEREPAAASVAA